MIDEADSVPGVFFRFLLKRRLIKQKQRGGSEPTVNQEDQFAA